jgi:hypothetical protein
MSWLAEDTLTDGHRAALARARRISGVRARVATFRRLGIELPAQLLEELAEVEASQAPDPLPGAVVPVEATPTGAAQTIQ